MAIDVPIMGGVAASIAALILLRLAWGRKQGGRGLLVGAGWVLVALSLLAGGLMAGEPGVARAALAFAALTTLYAGYLYMRAPGSPVQSRQKAPREDAAAPEGAGLARRVWVFVLAGPLAAIATSLLCGLCFALVARMGGATADAVVFASLLAPLIWGALLCWLLMDASLARRTFGVIGAAALGAVAFALV